MSERCGNVNRCDCGNLFVPNSKDQCPPCTRAARKVRYLQRLKARAEKRARRIADRLAAKQRKTDKAWK